MRGLGHVGHRRAAAARLLRASQPVKLLQCYPTFGAPAHMSFRFSPLRQAKLPIEESGKSLAGVVAIHDRGASMPNRFYGEAAIARRSAGISIARPAPRTTQGLGFLLIVTGRLVQLRSTAAWPGRWAPPPAR